MPEVTVNFDLSRLSDRMLNMLVRGANERERTNVPLVRAMVEQLTVEKIARQTQPYVARDTFTFDPGIAFGDSDEVALRFGNLALDIAALESGAQLARPGSSMHQEITAAAEFLFRVAESLKPLLVTHAVS